MIRAILLCAVGLAACGPSTEDNCESFCNLGRACGYIDSAWEQGCVTSCPRVTEQNCEDSAGADLGCLVRASCDVSDCSTDATRLITCLRNSLGNGQ